MRFLPKTNYNCHRSWSYMRAMARLARVLYVCTLLHLISTITDISANFLFQHSIESNGSTRVPLVGGLGIEPETVWNCLCKGTQLEFYSRRGIHEANAPNAPVQPPGAGNPNTPSAFQDPTAGLAFYQVSSAIALSDDEYMGDLDEVSAALGEFGVQDDSKYYAWNAWVSWLSSSSCIADCH